MHVFYCLYETNFLLRLLLYYSSIYYEFFIVLQIKNILNELGKRLKKARINKNITIEDLSLQSGITSRTIQNIESGKSANTKNIIAILRALRLLEHLDNFIPEQKNQSGNAC